MLPLEQMNDLARRLENYRFRFGNEKDLQDGVALALFHEDVLFTREQKLARSGTIDFLVGRIGIECKVDGGASAVLAQLQRYALTTELDALILVTSRHTHRFETTVIGGKPFRVVWIAGRSL